MPYPGLIEILNKKKNLDNIKTLGLMGASKTMEFDSAHTNKEVEEEDENLRSPEPK